MTPDRPRNVPASARYEADNEEGFRWVEGAFDADGKKHGPYRAWADAGYLHNECTYLHGVMDGDNRVFHPDGQIASVGVWRNGTALDAEFFRAAGDSPEPFPGDAGPNVVRVRYATHDGIANYVTRYFDKDGVEVCDNGDPMPARPDGVDAEATFYPSRGTWLMGSIKRGTGEKIRTWKTWSAGGVLREHEVYDDEGVLLSERDYTKSGALKRATTYDAAGEELTYERYEDGTPLEKRERDGKGRLLLRAKWRNGVPVRELRAEWNDDGLVSFVQRGEDGAVVAETEPSSKPGLLECRLYDDGKVVAAGLLTAGLALAGSWTIVDAGGGVRRRIEIGAPVPTEIEPGDLSAEALSREVVERVIDDLVARGPSWPALDAVSFDGLSGTSRSASSLSRYFRALASGEPFVRGTALFRIRYQVEHQGSVYPCTVVAVPLLVALAEERADLRTELLAMANECAAAAAQYEAEAKNPRDPGEKGEDWRAPILGTLAALGGETGRLLNMLVSADDDQKKIIVSLLGRARGGAAESSLESIARTSPDAALRATAINALFDARREATDALRFGLDDGDALVRTITALRLALREGPASPPVIMKRLGEAFSDRENLRGRYAALPFTQVAFVAHLALAIGSVRSPEAFALARDLIAALSEVDAVSASLHARGLLALAFGPCKLPFMDGFIDVLEGLAQSERFFAFDVDAADELRRFGLPARREGLVALVEELRADADPATMLHSRMRGGPTGRQ